MTLPLPAAGQSIMTAMQYVSTTAAQDVTCSAESRGANGRNPALCADTHDRGAELTVRVERFVFVGAACALLSNGSIILLVRYGLSSVTASALAFGPVLLAGYALHSIFTFGLQPSRLTFARYALATAANFPLCVAALYVLGDVLRIPIAIAAPLTTALLFLWNYVAARWAWESRWWLMWRR
jgi:putative flippase GtrA